MLHQHLQVIKEKKAFLQMERSLLISEHEDVRDAHNRLFQHIQAHPAHNALRQAPSCHPKLQPFTQQVRGASGMEGGGGGGGEALFAGRLKAFYWFTGGLRCGEETRGRAHFY